jgi:PAS domain S-box-containing protein
MKFSFRIKITLILIILTITPLLLNGIFIISNSTNFLEEKALQNLKELNNLLSIEIEGFILKAFKEANAISQNPIIFSSYVPIQEKEKEIKKIVAFSGVFQNIALLDPSGKIITFTSPEFYEKWKSNLWFLKAKHEKRIVMSDIYAYLDFTQPTLNFFIPIFSENKEIYLFAVAQLNLEKIIGLIQNVKIGEKGIAMLINSRGEILAHPYRSLFFEKISQDYPLKKVEVEKESAITFNFLGEEVIGFSKILNQFQEYQGYNWHLILIQPKEEILALTKTIRNQFGTALLFISLFMILVSYFLSRYITDPLLKLEVAAKEIAKGNFQVQVKVKTKDEFETLASTFNEMAKELFKFYTSLEKIKRDLESQVKIKTLQLEALTENLKAEVNRQTQELQIKVKELEDTRKALLNILEDVNQEKKKAEEEREKTLQIINNFADGLLVFDREGKLSLINPIAEKFFGIEGKNILGKSTNELASLSSFKPLIELLGFELKKIFRKELIQRENLILEVTTLEMWSEKEKIGVLVILHDITREKMVEKMKTEFVSVAAHQLRTPLSAIKWTLRLLLDGDLGKITETQREFLEKTYKSNERMILLINDLLNVTRIEEGRYLYNLTLIDFESTIESLVNSYKEEVEKRNLKLEFQKPKEKLPLIKADPEKIKLAIQNLIENSIKYTPEGGRILISLKKNKNLITFSIKDTGVGIPKDQQQRVFSKFFRAENAIKMNTEGSGLGLFITKNIIEAHGGKIWFESEEGKGTTFYFNLPAEESK